MMTGSVSQAGAEAAAISGGDLIAPFFSAAVSLVQLRRQQRQKAVLRQLALFLRKGDAVLGKSLREALGTTVKQSMVDLLQLAAQVRSENDAEGGRRHRQRKNVTDRRRFPSLASRVICPEKFVALLFLVNRVALFSHVEV